MTVSKPLPAVHENLQELERLVAEVPNLSLWSNKLRDHWTAKYENKGEETNAEVDLGKGLTFPEPDDDPFRLEVSDVLRCNPKNVLVEMSYHEDMFRKLKQSYVELTSKKEFLKRVLDIPPKFATEQEIREIESKSVVGKDQLKMKKAAVAENRQQLELLIETVHQKHVAVREQAERALEIMQEHRRLGDEVEKSNTNPNDFEEEIEEDREMTATQETEIAAMEEEIRQLQEQLDAQQAKNSALKERVTIIEPKKNAAEACAAEAQRISQSADPKMEELGIWYREQTRLLRHVQGVKQINHPDASRLEITYDIDGRCSCTLSVQFSEDYRVLSGWRVEAKLVEIPYSCAVSDLVANVNKRSKSLEESLSTLVRSCSLKARNLVLRELEVEELLQQYDGASWESESLQLILHIDATGRAFVVQLLEDYPRIGKFGIKVLGVEPQMMENDDTDEVTTWRSRIEAEDIQSLSDLVQVLE
ncbi:hypothetical protein DFS34DRAFT_254909 [Phlyctochytrium arcticum]|nr:hypothetical protein DFS34DRAFT_254909 [Phlyctochytrium arcticum]